MAARYWRNVSPGLYSQNQHFANFQTHNLHFSPDKNPAQQSCLPRNVKGIFVRREMKVYQNYGLHRCPDPQPAR